MIEEEIVQKIKEFTEKIMREDSLPSHEYEHILRVYNLCELIGEKENANLFVLRIAALMHDLARGEELRNKNICHAEKSAQIAEEKLLELNVDQNIVKQIKYAINVHRFSKNINPETKEAKILQDSDKLDGIGAIGIVRAFKFGAAHNRIDYDPNDILCENKTPNQKIYTVDHFYQKLFKLKDLMHTKTGKEIAIKREIFMKDFLKKLNEEIKGKN